MPSGAYEIESLDSEIERIFIDEKHYTEANYPITIKPNFSTLGSFIQIQPQRSIISFMFDDSNRDLLGFNARALFEEYNLSPHLVEILSFDNVFLECNIAQGMIFKGTRSGIIHIRTMTVDPGYIYVEQFAGGITWYMMERKDFFSSFSFKLKKQNNQLVSFNGRSSTFRLSIKEI